MMIFTSIYGVVDGFFVSNFVGKTPFAAINLIMPFLMICGAVGFMLGAGGSALVAKTMGEGDREKAKRIFSLLVYVSFGIGIVIAAVGMIFIRPISVFLGAEGAMIDDCVTYASIILPALPMFMLQNQFQSFLITAEKPGLGLAVTIAAGVTNMVLDALLVAIFSLGLVGAALATAASQFIGGVIPLIYFISKNKSPLRLGKTSFDFSALQKSVTNGSSEFVSNISMSLVGMVYNFQLMEIAGEDGVAAYGVIMYVSFIFIAVFLGYSIGAAPIIGFNFGAKNRVELKNVYKKSLIIMAIFSAVLTALGIGLSYPLSYIFVGYDADLLAMTTHAMAIYSISFAFAGFNIFASSFFTALGEGAISAIISFIRTLIFQILSVILLPMIMPEALKLDGVWLSIALAELLSIILSFAFIIGKRKKFGY